MFRWLVSALAFILAGSVASAEVVTRPIEYKQGAVVLEGVFAFDSAGAGKRPGVLIAHDGAGNGLVARQRATQFAKLGYVAFAIDLYGKGIAPKNPASQLGLTGKDRTLIRARAEAGFQVLTKQPQVDPKRIGGVGYGVGGTALLELARTGADLEGVAVLHADLSTLNPLDAKKISAAILVLVGSDDPKMTHTELAAFEDEMRGGGVDWRVLRFGGAAHDFTNPAAGRNLNSGAAYDGDAAHRAHAAIKAFLAESFEATPPPAGTSQKLVAQPPSTAPKGVPEKALAVLKYVDQHGEALPNYEGGRTFLNIEKVLPQNDTKGRRLKYREWDVNPHRPGVNRGAERLITASDGSAYFTDDHYKTFKKIR